MIGTLPTSEEAREFLNSKKTNKRELLVDQLLAREEFSTYWALKWADLLRVDRLALGHENAYLYYNWIRESQKISHLINLRGKCLLRKGHCGSLRPECSTKRLRRRTSEPVL